jgi:putative Mg2+ transporter-C (MgtC) family protein
MLGIQREKVGKAAGLRTHMLVSMGATLFVLAGLESGVGQLGLAVIGAVLAWFILAV